jgi:hypothetical protein
MRTTILLAGALTVLARAAAAQATVGAQGFGYPPGQVSVRALGTGSALAESDPQSALNPAALGSWGSAALYWSYAPEFRSVRAGGAEDHTRIARFPLIAAAFGVGSRGTIGFGSSTFLDRTWHTRFQSTQLLGGTQVSSTESFLSEGAINDVRLAGAWTLTEQLHVGLGAHAFTGENRLHIRRDFTDDSAASFQQTQAISYGGLGISGGVEWQPFKELTLDASARKGGTIRARQGEDTVLSQGKVPDRFGAGLKYDGIPGTSLAARVGWDGWSKLGALGTSGVSAFDACPHLGEGVVQLRAGLRWRTLPFGVAGAEAREMAFAGGTGLSIAKGRATIDIALQRAARSAGAARETAWTLGFGLSIRP